MLPFLGMSYCILGTYSMYWLYFQVEESTLDFESHLISIFLGANQNSIGLKSYVNVARSFNDIASETILSDVSMVILGFSIVFIYVTFVLGKFDCTENRVSKKSICFCASAFFLISEETFSSSLP